MQTPLALLLELLIIALLVLAATAPRVLRDDHTAVIFAVLDDSYSMSAQVAERDSDDDSSAVSARDRGLVALRSELARLPRYSVRLIAAGEEPRMLGGPATSWAQLEAGLEQWRPASAGADIGRALALAGEMGGPSASFW